jgi:hypothetical protein
VIAKGAEIGTMSEADLDQLPIITDKDHLDEYVGQLVVVQGVVTNTKIPTIMGIDVCSDSPDLRGQSAIVVGVLHKWIVTREELDRQVAKRGWFAHRGPGTFYRLVDVDSGEVAQVQPKH